MNSKNLFLLLFVISTLNFTTNALSIESLISDAVARQNQITYQVAIMGKKNGTTERELQCGGGIVFPDKILTAAQCFINEDGSHKELTFTVIVGRTNLTDEGSGFEILIKFIYLVQPGSYLSNDISIAELTVSLYTLDGLRITVLSLPPSFDLYHFKLAIIAGYGFNKVETRWSGELSDVIRVSGSTDEQLRFADVQQKASRNCFQKHHRHDRTHIMCARTVSGPWGICDLDIGSPLVRDYRPIFEVIGVASGFRLDCNDSDEGGLYTRTSRFTEFLNGVMFGVHVPRTIIYPNRPHEL